MNQWDNVQHYQEFQICLIRYSDSFIRYSAMHTSCIPASASSFSLSGRMWKEAEISPTEMQRGRLHREFVGCIRNCFSKMWLSCEVQHLTLLQLLPSETCGLALTLCWPGEPSGFQEFSKSINQCCLCLGNLFAWSQKALYSAQFSVHSGKDFCWGRWWSMWRQGVDRELLGQGSETRRERQTESISV